MTERGALGDHGHLPVPHEKLNRVGRASAVGIELAVAVIGCLLLGSWLDEKFGTAPWMTLGGIVLGSLAGLRSILRALEHSKDEPPVDRESTQDRPKEH